MTVLVSDSKKTSSVKNCFELSPFFLAVQTVRASPWIKGEESIMLCKIRSHFLE